MRYAIYYTPPKDSALVRTASAWLGRDAFSGHAVPHPRDEQLTDAEINHYTAPARRYGFHATLKAPFRLEEGVSEVQLVDALDRFAASMRPFPVDLRISRMGSFFALTSRQGNASLHRLADDVVTVFESFRAPLSAAEIARRNPNRLTPEELKNLRKWGYPHVFETFRFHMTLTGPVEPAESAPVEAALKRLFEPLLTEPLMVASLALFVEEEPGAPFVIRSWHPFDSQGARQSA